MPSSKHRKQPPAKAASKPKTKVAVEPAVSWKGQPALLALLALVGGLFARLAQTIHYSSGFFGRPASSFTLAQFVALTLTMLAMLTYLSYFRARFYFSIKWLQATLLYSGLVLLVKFSLSVSSYRGASRQLGSLLGSGLLVSILYMAIFTILYMFFDGKMVSPAMHKKLITTREGKALLAICLFFGATLLRLALFRLPQLSNTAASDYLNVVFKSNALLLSGALFVMIFAAVEAFAQVRRSQDLKYFYAMGMSLLLISHLWWALFMYRSGA